MLLMGKHTISMAIFNSYFDITRGYMLFRHMLQPSNSTQKLTRGDSMA